MCARVRLCVCLQLVQVERGVFCVECYDEDRVVELQIIVDKL